MIKTVFHNSIGDFSESDWNKLTESDSPFFDHAFLLSLEQGQCLTAQSGWLPHYLGFYEQEELIAAIPFYLKNHSYGEFIFDFQFAEAYARHGFAYYPKLVSAIPVTPVSGKRILLAPGIQLSDIKDALEKALLEIQQKFNLSSVHFLYLNKDEQDFLKEFNFLPRNQFEFFWHNQNYKSFDDFLAALNHKQRAQIRKERKEVKKHDVQIERLQGSQISKEDMEAAYFFYVHHHQLLYGSPTYLSREFFLEALQRIPENILLIMAKRNGRPVAGSINFTKGTGLFGRYWGYREDLKHMHFECCYYQQIEYAIEQNIQRFEAGAQGEHKIKRGLIPNDTHSAHWFAHPGFHKAIAEYLKKEDEANQERKAFYSERSPYKRG